MSAQHTPGPWTTRLPQNPITPLAAGDRMVLGRAFDGSEHAIVDRVRGGTPDQANANALLIAAAPDLLDALRVAVRTIRTWHGMGMGASEAQAWSLYQASPEMKEINAAFGKAEGRS